MDTKATRRYAVLKDVRIKGRDSPSEILQRFGSLAKSPKIRGVIQVTIIEADSTRTTARATFGQVRTKIAKSSKVRPRVELITAPETWSQIVACELSPIEAFLKGNMRVRGDVGLAQDLLTELAGSTGLTRLCGGGSP